ncbi:MAG: shikimate kinase [Oscillospiraceae bacterium]|nr:shikimate kinase [Oscillospiraceae bacterium]
MRNIVLIGMPGAGKSTVGVLLAKTIGYGFVDCDLLIQGQTGELLYKTIERDGIDAFLQTENRVISGLFVSRCVIATGGSAIFGDRAMEHLRESGVVVYLKLDPDEIERRIRNITTRGIAMNPGETIHDVYAVRAPLYEKWADVTVSCSGLTPEGVIEEILRQVPPNEL